jgi:hypothetical protein
MVSVLTIGWMTSSSASIYHLPVIFRRRKITCIGKQASIPESPEKPLESPDPAASPQTISRSSHQSYRLDVEFGVRSHNSVEQEIPITRLRESGVEGIRR